MNTFDIATCTDCAVVQMNNYGTGMTDYLDYQVRREWSRLREVEATGGVTFSGYVDHILFDDCDVCGEDMRMTHIFTCWT